jgi:hypothetical protein
MVKPVRPEDVADLKLDLIPDTVIEAFNEEIAVQKTGVQWS